MAATAFFFSNSFSYHGMTPSNLRGTPGPIDVHGIIKKNNASSWGFVVKDLTNVNATRVGAIRTIFLKPKMMLDQNKNYPYMVPDLGLGRMVKDGFVFRQNLDIRSYEVGPDQTASIETLLSHLQETSINHMKAIGVWGGGLGLTREMCKKNLIWVVAKLQLEVDRYPIWGDVLQIDTWKGAYGKNGMDSNWTFCDFKTGEILIRASCILVMMNKVTRRLSKFPDEVRGELEQYFTDIAPPTVKEDTRKWLKRDESIVERVRNGLMPRWSDLDINQHVNSVKYIGWILESVPNTIVENYELASMTLEYYRECRKESVLRSRTFVMGTDNGKVADYDHVDCEHVLQLEIEGGGSEIMKGWSRWRPKLGTRLGLESTG